MANEQQGNLGRPGFGPSDLLISIFRDCSRDPSEAIEARLRRMLHTFLQRNRETAASETQELAAKCCCEAKIWYYKILEKDASEERKRLGVSDISVLFENDLIQSCLVACCLEITISLNRLPCDFPLLLQILKLAPYHFWRVCFSSKLVSNQVCVNCLQVPQVIELVLRAEEGLHRHVFRHLAQVEEKVLESLAWTGDSPLWEELRANEGPLPTCQQVIPSAQLEDQMRTDVQPDANLPGAGLSTDQQRPPSADARPRISSPLHLFARKVYSLMARRLRELCSTLRISDELRLKIWTCFEYSLVHCTDLMVDRHLDQLLMCAIYIIAKITNEEILFKHIMECYNSQPLANRSVCKNVLISNRRDAESLPPGNENNGEDINGIPTPNTPSSHYSRPCQEERGNLIYFYNQIYTTKMESFAKQFAPSSGADTPPLSPYPRQGNASPRRWRLSGSRSFFISPYNTETAPPSTSGLSYYFNSSPPERLREINNMIRTGRPASRGRYVLPLDRGEEEEEGEGGPPVKRLRSGDH
ncbi:retinoblastoma-like protein 2 isoform X3 [Acanthopagrus latus]|uniref:retinoblastoma-like protein 2 isoform X3 n=1 Tax=Acanthopagrus latus TaxID=8177 RepID=UPI00187C84F6|nr:retinoblastoma-like protein 2 isoform X3 [Acanthopagrus latus]